MKKIDTSNAKIYMENPKWEKPQIAMSKKFTMVMREYRIDLKTMYPQREINWQLQIDPEHSLIKQE